MFRTLSTLIAGVSARSEDRVRDAFAIELIDQKIREAEAQLRAAQAVATMENELTLRDVTCDRLSEDRLQRFEEARNERLLAEYVGGKDED